MINDEKKFVIFFLFGSFLFVTIFVWSIVGIDNCTYIEFVLNGVESFISGLKYFLSRLI